MFDPNAEIGGEVVGSQSLPLCFKAASPRRLPSKSSCRRCARRNATPSTTNTMGRVGELVNCAREAAPKGPHVIVDLGRAEARMPKRETVAPGNLQYRLTACAL